MPSTDPAARPAAPRLAAQSGADDLVVETVHGVDVRCYAVRPGSVVQVLQDALAAGRGDDVLLVDPALGRTVTYGEFAALAEGAAAALAARCAPGDRVAFLGRHGLKAAGVIWVCARAGLVHVGLPVDAPPARHADLLDLVGAALVLVQSGLPLYGEDAALLLADPRPWDATRPLPDQDATYSLIPTSGTTGRPKAVRVTGRMTAVPDSRSASRSSAARAIPKVDGCTLVFIAASRSAQGPRGASSTTSRSGSTRPLRTRACVEVPPIAARSSRPELRNAGRSPAGTRPNTTWSVCGTSAPASTMSTRPQPVHHGWLPVSDQPPSTRVAVTLGRDVRRWLHATPPSCSPRHSAASTCSTCRSITALTNADLSSK